MTGPSPRPWGPRPLRNRRVLLGRSIPTPVGTTSRYSLLPVCLPVHPHARGDHDDGLLTTATIAGPSPRPWGPRLTASPLPFGMAVHPHARGDHGASWLRASAAYGPSPRPWGPPVPALHPSLALRSIPTPVGTTSARLPRSRRFAVHPHARGDHPFSRAARRISSGPSPRPWGPRSRDVDALLLPRSIPTPVGTTHPLLPGRGGQPVHPHARGDHSRQRARFSGTTGPSPRPWGPRLGRRPGDRTRRSIPTPVGTTRTCLLPAPAAPVHPHARGDHPSLTGMMWSTCGPSPRPWGPRQLGCGGRLPERSIPTPVGTTAPTPTASMPTSVHPHARGDHSHSPHRPGSHTGPSPRPWGPRRCPAGRAQVHRSIPTPVGTTPFR